MAFYMGVTATLNEKPFPKYTDTHAVALLPFGKVMCSPDGFIAF